MVEEIRIDPRIWYIYQNYALRGIFAWNKSYFTYNSLGQVSDMHIQILLSITCIIIHTCMVWPWITKTQQIKAQEIVLLRLYSHLPPASRDMVLKTLQWRLYGFHWKKERL